MKEFEREMVKLDELSAETSPHAQVYGYREILAQVWLDGFQAGHLAATRDRVTADLIARKQADRRDKAAEA